MDAPILQINAANLQNLIGFIYKHESLLKKFGAFKIMLNNDCKLALKKRRKHITSFPTTERIAKMCKNESIYFVERPDYIYESTQQNGSITDERNFWSSLPSVSNERRQLNMSLIPDKSFFSQKTSRAYFDIHRLPNQSILKLCGYNVTRQFVPCITRAHGSGAIFPLTSAPQHLFSIDYHHEGGARYWYIIPARERNVLQRIIDQQKSAVCLDHGRLLIDPSVLDNNHIHYHRIVQHPNEFVILAAGTLAQSFTDGASWNESIEFALPSWIEEGHASLCAASCQCDVSHNVLLKTIDVSGLTHELIQKYIASHLYITNDYRLLTSEGIRFHL